MAEDLNGVTWVAMPPAMARHADALRDAQERFGDDTDGFLDWLRRSHEPPTGHPERTLNGEG